jgi:hypothetical protein
MEKQFPLDQKEQTMNAQLDQERTQALAMVGALSLDMEAARKGLDAAQERQRSFIRQVLSARDLGRFENARVINGNLVVLMPDEPATIDAPRKPLERVNGSTIDLAKE